MNTNKPTNSELVAKALLRSVFDLRIALAIGLSTGCLGGCTGIELRAGAYRIDHIEQAQTAKHRSLKCLFVECPETLEEK